VGFNKKTIRGIDLSGKTVLLRADYNVPVEDGKLTDDYRIKQSVPTVQYLLDQNCKVIICSHLGRPKGPDDKEASLEPVAVRLGEIMSRHVAFVHDCIGDDVKWAAGELQQGQILLLENVRYHPEEEANDEGFARAIVEATGAEIFVQDGFGVVHRAHATTDAVARMLPSVAGFLLEKEVDAITSAMHDPVRPLMTIIGGAKIADKIDVLKKFVEISDFVAVIGGMANTFLLAEGHKMGKSLVDVEDVGMAQEIMEIAKAKSENQKFTFLIPVDVVVSTDIEGKQPTRIIDISGHTFADITTYPKQPPPEAYSLRDDEAIFDIGPMTAAMIAGAIKVTGTAIWNGAAGVTETEGLAGAQPPFEHGTKVIVDSLIGAHRQDKNKPKTVVGGGDTIGYVESKGLVEDFDHVSTGGGASLDLMAGKELPGVAVLQDLHEDN